MFLQVHFARPNTEMYIGRKLSCNLISALRSYIFPAKSGDNKIAVAQNCPQILIVSVIHCFLQTTFVYTKV